MNEIHRVVRSASKRLLVTDLLRTLAVTTTAGLGAVLAARVVQQVFGLEFPWTSPYGGIFAAVGAAAAVGAVAWAMARRRSDLEVAVEVDGRAGLRESLSTALCVERGTDAWSQAMLETAREKAALVQVGRAVPIEAPRMWAVPVATGAVLALTWFTLKPLDVLKLLEKKEKIAQAEKQVKEVKAEIAANDQKLQELLAQAKVEPVKDDGASKGDDAGREIEKPEDLQRAAVKNLTDVRERLKAMQTGEKADQDRAMKDMLRDLKQPGDGPLNEFSRQLSRGNFDQAQEAMKDLAQKIENDQLSSEQKAQLQKQLDNMSEQLKQVAQKQTDLQKKLEAAGMDKKAAEKLLKDLASNPEALKKALEQMKNLTPEQKQQLQQMAQAASQAAQQCENMAKGMDKMSEGMEKQGMSEEMQQGLSEVGSELGESEMLAQEMDSLNAAMSECDAQLAKLGECLGGQNGRCEGDPKLGEWQAGDSTQNQGNGSGGAGRGNYGGPRPDEAADYSIEKQKAKVGTGKGPIIGTRLVYGDQVKGEAQAEFSAVAEAAEKAAAEAINQQLVSREMQDPVRKYFSTMSSQGKKAPAAGDASKPAEPVKPASDATDAGKK